MIINELPFLIQLEVNAFIANFYFFNSTFKVALALQLYTLRHTFFTPSTNISTPTIWLSNLPFVFLYRITLKIDDDPP